MFLNTDTSTSAKPGPTSAFRLRLPAGSVVPAQPADPGTQKAAGLTHGSPPTATLKAWLTPAYGFPTIFMPGRCVPALKLKGWPLCSDKKELTCQPCVSHLGPWEDPGRS